jgi:drug/metabolite transporter (DMT)-like permease
MLAISLAFIACLGWGTSSFLAGMKSRVMPVLTLLFFSGIAGIIMFVVSLVIRDLPFPRDPNLLWAVLGGASGVIGLFCLYRGLAVGAISIVVPVSALCVVLPVMAGLIRGETLHPIQGLGIIIAVGGGILISLEKKSIQETAHLTTGFLPAVGAALGFGGFYITMDLAGAADPLWAAMVSRSSSFMFLLPAVLYKRPTLKIKGSHFPAVCAIGLLDSVAAFSYTAATTIGMLSLVAVISALYPVVSIILAAMIFKERLRRSQIVAVTLIILGVLLISAL